MPLETPRRLLEVSYYQAAQEYLRNLPPEHFMEATPQATQREITLASFAVIEAQRPDVHRFNELLVQYPLTPPRKNRKIGQVVPDNMIVLHEGPISAEGSYDIPLQPAGPHLVLEYVSKSSKRKDYDDNMQKYEQDLKVPYYLLFYPEVQERTLYRHTADRYAAVPPDSHGRHAIAELDVEVALLDGWVRYWFRGQLVPLPADLLAEVEKKNKLLRQKDRQLQNQQKQLRVKDEQLQARDEELRIQTKQLQVKDEQMAAMTAELERLRQQLGEGQR